MTIKEFENLVLRNLKNIIEQIITENLELPISAKARAGAEISYWLEKKFVEYTNDNNFFEDSESAPNGRTKNPWDARTKFVFNNYKEEIWIDFKAFKISSANSNPDIGTPKKIIKLISEGKFYYTFIYVFYEETDGGLRFVKFNNSYTKLYFLKDINKSFRRNPKNQLQVNILAEPEYRTREEFINILVKKIKEGLNRQIKIAERDIEEIDKIREELIVANKKSEKKLKEHLKRFN